MTRRTAIPYWQCIPVILLSLAYGIAVCAGFVVLTARTWYLIETRSHRQRTGRLHWLSKIAREFIWPSQHQRCEQLHEYVATFYGYLFGMNLMVFLLAARNSWVEEGLEPYGLLAYPLIITVALLLMVLELVITPVLSMAIVYVCICVSRKRSGR